MRLGSSGLPGSELQIPPLRFGRDDTSVLGLEVCYEEFGRPERRTADPSTALRFGRDDKGESGDLKGRLVSG
jgi:hypothetical protein